MTNLKLKPSVRKEIEDLLIKTVETKLEKYKPETESAPFHYRLLGRDRYAMFSFLQSLNTTLGVSIWEQIAEILAKGAGREAKHQYDLFGEVNSNTNSEIVRIIQELREGKRTSDKVKEANIIKRLIKSGIAEKDADSRVDFYVVVDGTENYFDITSAKPNMKEFVSLKQKLLRWMALRWSVKKSAKVITRLAIPYNPYHPKPYERWTLQGLYDLKGGEVLVGEEFWNFVGGGDIYGSLLNVFEDAGKKLRTKIDKKFSTI